jgi:hypothetical protein
MSTPVEQKWESIKGLIQHRDVLNKKLERSFMLQGLAPGAFRDGGGAVVSVTGNPFNLLIFKVRSEKDGYEQHFQIEDVPIELWPERVVTDVRNAHGSPTPYLLRIKRYVDKELARISG